MKRIGLLLFLSLSVLPLAAQETGVGYQPADTAYIFRFVPQKDVFFVPYADNQAELNRLCRVLQENAEHLRAGRMYICVSSYAATSNTQTNALRMGYLRNSRVKSELIQRVSITEKMFVTDKLITTPYDDSLRNVVVVTFPASVEKIEQIAGVKAAEVVRSYYREIEKQKQLVSDAQRVAEQQKQQEFAAREAAANREAEATRQRADEAEAQRQDAECKRLAAEEQARLAVAANAKPYAFALRANLLRWATLTPDLGVEWRVNRHVGILVNGTWTSWSWDNRNRRYALWQVSPEVCYYIGKEKRGYMGAMYQSGEFNYKLGEKGYQGDNRGGGITGGYMLRLCRTLSLDFQASLGYTRADYDTYIVTDGVKVRTGNHSKNYWGVNKAGVTLVWKLF